MQKNIAEIHQKISKQASRCIIFKIPKAVFITKLSKTEKQLYFSSYCTKKEKNVVQLAENTNKCSIFIENNIYVCYNYF